MKNWSLNKKIWSILGLLIVAFASCVYLSLNSMNTIRENLNEITSVIVKRDQLTSTIQDNQRLLTIATREIILQPSEEKMRETKKSFEETLAKQRADLATYNEIASEKGKELAARYLVELAKWTIEMERAMKLTLNKQDKEAVEVLFGAGPIIATMRNYIGEMNELTAKTLAEKSEQSNATAGRAIQFTLFSSIASILASLAIAFAVLKAVTGSINQIVRNLFDSSAQVSTAAGQIASSSEELSQSTTEQAASLEQTAASIEEMSSMVGKNSENAKATAGTSTKSQQKATEGKAVVEEMIQSMDEINESNQKIMTQVNHGNERISEIVKVIEEIGTKTKVINDIVFQTKLLSFNASVEAARAGEHGKGFAVVAEEVGNLAQMSGNAAKEISSLLDGSILKVNQIVTETKSTVEKLINEGKETVENGTQVARKCGEMLEEIVQNVSNVSSMAGEIALASEEQSRGVTEITKAMGQLDQVTQQNSATSEECASAAEELSAQAESLKSTVEQLVLTIQGTGANGSQQADQANYRSPSQTSAGKGPSNVLSFKGAKKSSGPAVSEFKKASGDGTPNYNHAGFEDV